MADALYGPDGFYTSGRGAAGRRGGDFITSPEVGPLFGVLVGRWLDQVFDDLGQPEQFDVFDLGSGPGTLATAVRQSAPRCAPVLTMTSIDIASDTSLPTDLSGSVVIANELLDNIPFRWIRNNTEAFVANGQLVWRPTDIRFAEGDYPWIEQARALVENLLDRGVSHLMMTDYGALTTTELAARGDWLRTYHQHERAQDPLEHPGFRDITTDIPVDQLPQPASVQTQTDFLRSLGIDELVEEGRTHWLANAARPGLEAMKMRSRINEAAALTDPTGLGAFLVMHWRNNA